LRKSKKYGRVRGIDAQDPESHFKGQIISQKALEAFGFALLMSRESDQ